MMKEGASLPQTSRMSKLFVAGLLFVVPLAAAACAGPPATGGPPTMLPPREPAPFGSHAFTYQGTPLRPTGAQATLDQAVKTFYDRWKSRYLQNGCGGSYVRTQGGTGSDDAITISEAHGYGMMLLALMSGHDPKAQETFDGFVKVFRTFPSNNNRDLMAWAVGASCMPVDGPDSATDGDLDVAFALLLGHRQWGSGGAVKYDHEAAQVVAAIAKNDFNSETALPLLGDWAHSSGYYYSTRPSDFMPDHFRAFATVSTATKSLYERAIDRTYQVVEEVQHASGTGLVPDFAVGTNGKAKPAPPMFLEGANDGEYSYNACRAPWRLGTDYIVSGDERAKRTAGLLTKWLKNKTSGNPGMISAGYSLDGIRELERDDNGAFIGPFAVAAMASGDSANQAWLDSLWKWMVETPAQEYYADSIRLLSMIVVSGNWITP
jgi:endo-1,4-beta-D-glucanase Y